MELIKVFKISDTLNNRVNIEKLSLELKTSTISVYSSEMKFGDEIFVRYPEEISEQEVQTLTAIINAHDGEDAEAYNEDAVSGRENKIRELNQLAMFHPLLDNVETVRFLTFIDNYINAYVRSGIATVVHEKIIAEAQAGDYVNYLNQVVNTAGNKVFEYFVSKIN